jgi:hypothetical protein
VCSTTRPVASSVSRKVMLVSRMGRIVFHGTDNFVGGLPTFCPHFAHSYR